MATYMSLSSVSFVRNVQDKKENRRKCALKSRCHYFQPYGVTPDSSECGCQASKHHDDPEHAQFLQKKEMICMLASGRDK